MTAFEDQHNGEGRNDDEPTGPEPSKRPVVSESPTDRGVALHHAALAVVALKAGYSPMVVIFDDDPYSPAHTVSRVRPDDYVTKIRLETAGDIFRWMFSNPGSDDLSELLRLLTEKELVDPIGVGEAWDALEILFDIRPLEGWSQLDSAERVAAWESQVYRTRRVLLDNHALLDVLVAEIVATGHVTQRRIKELAESVSQ